jgi:hypothetical protein
MSTPSYDSTPIICYPVSIPVSGHKVQQTANELAKGCETLLSKVRDYRNKGYRIELLLDGDKGVLRLCLDPVIWYDDLCDKIGKVAVDVAKDFSMWAFQEQRKKRENYDDLVCPKEMATGGKQCSYKPCKPPPGKPCQHLHKYWTCPSKVQHLSKEQVECGFSAWHENRLQIKDIPSGWDLFKRLELTREVLIMPHPNIIQSGEVPHGNVGMVKTPRFWEVVQTCCQQLQSLGKSKEWAVTRVVINFGRWETGMRVNPYLEECHAHAHLWLTKDFISNYEPLKKHDYAPEDYVLKNARQLEKERLFHDRMAELTSMATTINSIHATLTTNHRKGKKNREVSGVRREWRGVKGREREVVEEKREREKWWKRREREKWV